LSASTKSQKSYKRIVAKFGTNLLTNGSDHLDIDMMSKLVDQLSSLHKEGRDISVVTSGAVAAGKNKLGISKKIKGIPFKQVLAAVGQSNLMYVYEELFDKYGIVVAQALLTRSVLCDRAGYLNARNTLLALIELRVISVINENDVVATEELKGNVFGDNDNLSAMVANLIDADLLIILSDVDGLYDSDPGINPSAKLIPVVEKIDDNIISLAGGTRGKYSTGGMITKLQAAKLASSCGIAVVIAKGTEPDVIKRLAEGEKIGTTFLPEHGRVDSRERWMLAGLSVKGKLFVDDGAEKAIIKNKSSLLAAGITGIEGYFQHGDMVDIYNHSRNKIGSGISNYSHQELQKIKGVHSRKINGLLGYDYGSEVVHRNNLVLF
jgi:glutamate 5-kinase